ncbi:hypothetical protein [Cellulophaga omnivescoria]|uniref:hypothetical protein n=1 Tax=Cellulophaga omnivescoria TaxID=1888890 RepID=UPI0022F101C9|nr:hypothetical protein [Cellulophaga omnivescoria]WBU88305.1 hypothetical protein PBN93_10535 [Cellulophaga omnivescoria]
MYISPVDLLGLSLDELMNLDNRGIIRLEKTLKVQRLQTGANAYNPEQVSSIVKQLSSDEQKKSVYFIEKHRYLKEFITTGKDNGEKTFIVDAVLLANTPNIKEFLEPYFEAYFMKMVKKDFAAKKYDTIIKAMQHKELFTDNLLSIYYRYIKAQADIITEKVKISANGDLISRCPEIAYKTYIYLLNTVSLGVITKSKTDYVNAMIDYYNITKNIYGEFPSVQRAFRNFKLIEVASQETKDYYVKIANHVGSQHWVSQTKYSTSKEAQKSKGSSSSGVKTIAIVIGIVIFLVRVGRIFTSSSSSSSNYSTYSSPNYKIPTLEFSYEDDKTAFYSDLIHKAENDSLDINNKIIIKSGTTPYSASFKSNEGLRSGDFIKVLNKRTRPFILFEHFKVIKPDYAAYTRPNDSFKIMNKNYLEELVFYMGDDFVGNESLNRETYGSSTKLSASKKYFKSVNEKELSFLKNKYVIDSLGADPNIVVYDDNIVFTDIYYHTVPHKILPPEVEEVEIVEETVIGGPRNRYTNPSTSVWEKDKSIFFKNMFKNAEGNRNVRLLNFDTGDNPYPDLFKGIYNSTLNGYEVTVNNKSDEDMFLFTSNFGLQRDQATFIKSDDSVVINLHDEGDTLYFYMGQDFYKVSGSYNTEDLQEPRGYFKTSSKTAKKYFNKNFLIEELGLKPQININIFGVDFVDIKYKEGSIK